MSFLGGVGFPGLHNLHKMARRAPINPMDKSTIVSIFPREFTERKHTIQPGVFTIPAGTLAKPALYVVGPSSWWREIDDEQPPLEIPHSSLQVAHSIVYDWANGLFCCDMGGRMPGIFYVPGEVTSADLKTRKDVIALLNQADIKQKAWFEELIKQADVVWSRTNGNPLTITEDMKLAAIELGRKDKPWLKDAIYQAMVPCPACGTLKNPNFPICGSCKTVVDSKRFEELGLAQVK